METGTKVDPFWYIFGFCMLTAGCTAGYFAIRCCLLARASRFWPSAPGTIVKSFLQVHSNSEGAIGATAYVEYEYLVDEKQFNGKRIRFGAQNSMSNEKAQVIADRYPQGGAVPIYHNPQKPSICTLERGVWTKFVVLFGLSSLAFVVGSLIGLVYLMKK